MNIQSNRIEFDSYEAAIEKIYENGWTDGLPVIPPTEERVEEFLEFLGCAPDEVIGEIPERDRVVTAEKLVINAVMAGCKKEYLPIVVTAVQGVTEPKFNFNHLASLGSPTPIMMVSGPIVDQIGMNYERYVIGQGARANATIGRALSLILWNCAEMRLDGILRGTYGNPLRWNSCCMAENPHVPEWQSLREQLGFSAEQSTVTMMSASGGYTAVWTKKPGPEDTLMAIADALVTGGGNFNRGVYVVVMAPPIIERFTKTGWTTQDVRQWFLDNAGRGFRDLRRRGRWGIVSPDLEGFPAGISSAVESDEDDRFLHLFQSNGDIDRLLWDEGQREREADVYLVAAGGDVATYSLVISQYSMSTSPVTKPMHAVQIDAPFATAQPGSNSSA